MRGLGWTLVIIGLFCLLVVPVAFSDLTLQQPGIVLTGFGILLLAIRRPRRS
jgi:hypothetical protein